MHAFIKGWRTRESTYYGAPFHLDECQDEVETRLADLLPKTRVKGHYEYDFGDSWMHEIVLEKIAQESARPAIAVCLAGKRAAPKEDCGGAYGFYEALAAAKNPKHPEHEDYNEWLGNFDPESFRSRRAQPRPCPHQAMTQRRLLLCLFAPSSG